MWLTMIGTEVTRTVPETPRKLNVKRADLALDPLGMKRSPFARSRQLQRAVSQTLVEAHADRFLHGNQAPSDGRIVDAKQSRGRRQRSSSTDGKDVAKIVPIHHLHFCRMRLR